ncbi:MAG TPA: glycosyltransferase family 4 protein [Sedimentisphaerales bacterium]|nr:glycosyltransferase family 4 protein [Sedimentisphaerales bacterium]HRS11977.1 glycosyltransferase family 4 protein [Sedimentisphaerales bacterium]HRV49033.1 glycosyltransferase family 4 protein [Sedimentisphaerales bacterium]
MDRTENTTLAFCLYRYFPHGGLQRDMLRIALACRQRGYRIAVYTTAWAGDVPEGFELHVHRPGGLTNHGRMRRFHRWLTEQLDRQRPACVVGFNKMPGLDIYYAADGCLKARALEQRGALYRWLPRYRQYQAFEEAVFGRASRTHILMLSSIQQALYVRHYGTPEHRIHFLPPNVAKDRVAGPDAPRIRRAFRQESGLQDDDRLLVQVGSGFRTKGLDRSLRALASLPDNLRARTHFYVVGDDNRNPYVRLSRRLGIADHVTFLGPREDVPRILLGADLLIHPAYHENTGTVLLEALVAGLPVIATAVCGYAHYIDEARAGWIVPEPFDQQVFNRLVRDALENDRRQEFGRRGIEFAQTEDLTGMVEAAVKTIEAVASTRAGR